MSASQLRSLAICSVLAVLGTTLVKKVLKAWRANPAGLPYPPGPPPLPLIGNVRQLPQTLPWLTYTEWGRQYGPLIHATAFDQHFIIVNSLKVATDLFDKRSHIYSDRPLVPMVDLMGWDFNLGLMPYGDKWKRYRRMLQQYFRRGVSLTYRPIQRKKIHELMLKALLSSPENFRDHIRNVPGSIIMSTVYGYDIEPVDDHFVTLAEKAVHKLGESVFPGAAAVNMLPILRHLPGWLPGCGFQRFAAEAHELTDQMQQAPYEFAKHNMQEGKDSTSMVAKILEASQARGNVDQTMIQGVAGVAYAAGSDTTVSALSSFFLAMALFPEIQRKAQDELDATIGTHRLPDFTDRPNLPYVEAIYREVMRWKPVLPLSVARSTSEDDIYEGYFIPKGATVIANIWAMSYDEAIYQEPERFNPERYINADGELNDDQILAFGSGRRICVGRHVAEETVWGTIASVLSTFNIGKAKDAEGNEIEIVPIYSDGLISHLESFPCSITPRSEEARRLVLTSPEESS